MLPWQGPHLTFASAQGTENDALRRMNIISYERFQNRGKAFEPGCAMVGSAMSIHPVTTIAVASMEAFCDLCSRADDSGMRPMSHGLLVGCER